MKLTSFALAVLLLAGCSSLPEEPHDTTLTLRFGESANVPGTSTPVTFIDVSDSRCPSSVVCAWAGDAAVTLQSGGDTVTLHTNTSAGVASDHLNGWTVTLMDVQPARTTTEAPKKADYAAGLQFTR
ncbi:MAG TPA: hypothetical protein VLU46_15260 [Thermoanaerobaculia bacterium]|nr:hypothetical protein [Thermoanaerobaculia bacterium]